MCLIFIFKEKYLYCDLHQENKRGYILQTDLFLLGSPYIYKTTKLLAGPSLLLCYILENTSLIYIY